MQPQVNLAVFKILIPQGWRGLKNQVGYSAPANLKLPGVITQTPK